MGYKALSEWPRAKLFMRKLMAIALLPAHCMTEAFEDLVTTADIDITTYFQDLIAYYRRYWLGRVTPRRYSVYNQVHRTNNPLEAYHRILGMYILDVAVKSMREVLSSNGGLPVRRETEAQYVRVEVLLDKAWDLFVRNRDPVDYRHFLTAASHIFSGFGEDLLCTNVGEIEELQNVNSYEEEIEMFPDIQSYRIQDDHHNIHVLHRTGCLMCNCKYLATNMSLPCYHWASCGSCTQRSLQLAREQDQVLVCATCNNPVEWFAELDEERQIGK